MDRPDAKRRTLSRLCAEENSPDEQKRNTHSCGLHRGPAADAAGHCWAQAVTERNASPLATGADNIAKAFQSTAGRIEALVLLVVAQRRGEQGGHYPRLRGDEKAGDRRGAVVRRRAGRARGPARAAFHEPRVAGAIPTCRPRGGPLRHRPEREPVQRLERGRPVGNVRITPPRRSSRASTVVKGPGHISVSLPQPEKVHGFYRDVAVLACPVPKSGSPQAKFSASSSYRDYPPALAQDGSTRTRWISNGDKPGMGPTPAEARVPAIRLRRGLAGRRVVFEPLRGLRAQRYRGPVLGRREDVPHFAACHASRRDWELTLAFEEVRAKHFRVVFLSAYPFMARRRGTCRWPRSPC